MECTTCRAVSNEVVLTNGPRIELDDHWRLEHCHPVAVPGWLVLVLRRHARSLHELSDAESASLGRWIAVLPKALHAVTGCELEYVMQFAEGEGFHHVHFHLVARAAEWRSEWKGPLVFSALGSDDQSPPMRSRRSWALSAVTSASRPRQLLIGCFQFRVAESEAGELLHGCSTATPPLRHAGSECASRRSHHLAWVAKPELRCCGACSAPRPARASPVPGRLGLLLLRSTLPLELIDVLADRELLTTDDWVLDHFGEGIFGRDGRQRLCGQCPVGVLGHGERRGGRSE